MSVELANVQPLYQQVYKSLRDDIKKGVYKPSDRLPTEPELSAKYNVSVTTIRQAVTLLVADRSVYRRQGKGTFVADSNDDSAFKKVKNLALICGYPKDHMDGRYEILPTIIHEMEDEASNRGCHISIFNTQDDFGKARERIKSLAAADIDGAVFWPAVNGISVEMNRMLAGNLMAMKIPLILFDRRVDGYKLDYVASDNQKGAYQLVRHLIDRRHRRIAIISDPESSTICDRILGYKKALQEANIEIDPRLICINPHQGDMAATVEHVRSLVRLDDRPTAIFATYDNLAQTTIQSLAEMGLSVPGDIAVAGYDNRQFAAALSLTTVDQHFGKMARTAIRRLCQKIENRDDKVKALVIKSELIVRGSTGVAQ